MLNNFPRLPHHVKEKGGGGSRIKSTLHEPAKAEYTELNDRSPSTYGGKGGSPCRMKETEPRAFGMDPSQKSRADVS